MKITIGNDTFQAKKKGKYWYLVPNKGEDSYDLEKRILLALGGTRVDKKTKLPANCVEILMPAHGKSQ